MLRNRVTGSIIVTLLCLAFASSAFAQVNTATLLGQVTDSSGAAGPNATITVRNLMTAVGTFGNIGFNMLRGPKAIDLDISVLKAFPVWHEHQLQFRAEFFNFPNRANFNNPVNTFSNPAFGRIQTAGAGRNVQLSLRYQF